MLDIKFIRENPQVVKETLQAKGVKFDFDYFLEIERKRRDFIQKIDEYRARQNKANEEIKKLITENKDPQKLIPEVKEISRTLSQLESEYKSVKDEFNRLILAIPNIPHSSVPRGDASCNKLVKEWGQKRNFSFKPLTHIELAEHLDIIDFRRASKICGSHFSLFKGKGARLVRALINFMLDLHTTKHNYTEVFPPYLANRDSMTATGQLPKMEEDMYKLSEDDYFLIPTAEVPLTNIHRDEILNEKELPVYYVGYSACFRREAGSYGKDTRGMVRVHQFDKVELVKFVKPENSYEELESLLNDACEVIEMLGIPYRVMLLASGDLSFAAAKCYDIEIYAPGIDRWLEVSSCSNFENFQARRGNIRYRDSKTNKLRFVHTLNGSGVALARLIVALLENNQNPDGSVTIPSVLRTYFNGEMRITK